MKPILFCLIVLFSLTACDGLITEPCETSYYNYEPVYENIDHIRTVSYEPARSIESPGKIYVYGSYLLVNEMNQGIHIIDNTNQRNPQNIGFYEIMGNNDLAVKNNILYADNYLDVLSIDISTITEPEIIDIAEQIYDYPFYVDDETNQFVVDWVIGDLISQDCEGNNWLSNTTMLDSTSSFSTMPTAGVSANPNLVGQGQAGSMARFALNGDHLYVVDNTSLHAITIETPSTLDHTNSVQLDWGVETIFPYQDKLFIGARTGMHIFALDNPAVPTFASTYTHFEACDPVIVSDDIAYVTVRTDGNWCGERGNQLLKLDVQNIYEPELLQTLDMTNPHGLGMINDHLFICEAEAGIRVYQKDDINDYEISEIASIMDVDAKDIILLANQTAIVLTGEHFKQYDISDLNQIEELSLFAL